MESVWQCNMQIKKWYGFKLCGICKSALTSECEIWIILLKFRDSHYASVLFHWARSSTGCIAHFVHVAHVKHVAFWQMSISIDMSLGGHVTSALLHRGWGGTNCTALLCAIGMAKSAQAKENPAKSVHWHDGHKNLYLDWECGLQLHLCVSVQRQQRKYLVAAPQGDTQGWWGRHCHASQRTEGGNFTTGLKVSNPSEGPNPRHPGGWSRKGSYARHPQGSKSGLHNWQTRTRKGTHPRWYPAPDDQRVPTPGSGRSQGSRSSMVKPESPGSMRSQEVVKVCLLNFSWSWPFCSVKVTLTWPLFGCRRPGSRSHYPVKAAVHATASPATSQHSGMHQCSVSRNI